MPDRRPSGSVLLNKGRIDRQPTDTIQLKVRMSESLRAALAEQAEFEGRSLNAEIASRLEKSFEMESDFGGPEIYHMARMMASAFLIGGQHRAFARGIDRSPEAWISDEECYRSALLAVVTVLQSVDIHGLDVLVGATDTRKKLKTYLDRLMETAHDWKAPGDE